jgi:hypothetical protein
MIVVFTSPLQKTIRWVYYIQIFREFYNYNQFYNVCHCIAANLNG